MNRVMNRMKIAGFVAAAMVLIFFTACGGGTSALVDRWSPEDGDSVPRGFPDNLELFKDGAGAFDGDSITWKAERGRLMFNFLGAALVYDYKVSGSNLTLTNDDGRSATFINRKTAEARARERERKEAEERAAAEREREREERERDRYREDDLAMVSVSGGTFTMGCTPEQGRDCLDSERPAHSVTVGNFEIGKYEVTQRLWERYMGNNPSNFRGNDLPVESVSWDDVQEFIRKLNEQTGERYRLPTEAEWEFAARGGGSSKGFKYSGGNSIGEVAWFDGNSGSTTHPIGTKNANELGIHDMSGNVSEWLSDWYGNYSGGSVSDPRGPSSGSRRVARGGNWVRDAVYARVSDRRSNVPGDRPGNIGFRLARSSR